MPKDKQTLTWSDMESIGSVSDLVNAHPTKEPTSFEIRPSADEKPTAITPAMAIEKKVLADMRREEASDVLLWLNNNGCLSTSYGTMDKALAAIEAGKHRR